VLITAQRGFVVVKIKNKKIYTPLIGGFYVFRPYMTPFITITTDFGDDFAISQLKAVIFSLGFTGQIIENHDVSSFSVLEGAYGI